MVFILLLKKLSTIKGLYGPISRALYPHISDKVTKDRNSALIYIYKYSKTILPIMFTISLSLFLFADQIVEILLGENYADAGKLIKIMSFVPLLVSFSDILSVQIMLNFGYEKEFLKFVLINGLIGLLISIPLIYLFSIIGAAIALLLSELLITTIISTFLLKDLESDIYEGSYTCWRLRNSIE